MITVSIIIPVYNGTKYIAETIDSILVQTLQEIEIIVVNDGSTDNTLDVLNTYKDSRLRVITQPNSGTFAARIRGFKEARGAYVGYVDSDDMVKSTMFEELYVATLGETVDIVSCGLLTDKGRIHGRGWHATPPARLNGTQPYLALLDNTLWGYCCNKIYRRTLLSASIEKFLQTIHTPLVMAEDFFQNVLLFSEASSFAHIQTPLYIYRLHTGSIMRRVDTHTLERRLSNIFIICSLVESYFEFLGEKDNVSEYVTSFQHKRWDFAKTAIECVHLMGSIGKWNRPEYQEVFDYFGDDFSQKFEELRRNTGCRYRVKWWVKRNFPGLIQKIKR